MESTKSYRSYHESIFSKAATLSALIFTMIVPVMADQKADDEVKFIAAGIQDAREKEWCAQARITTTAGGFKEFYEWAQSVDVPTPTAPADSKTVRQAWWRCKGDSLSMLVQPLGADEDSTESILGYQKIAVEDGQARILGEFFDRAKAPGQERFKYYSGTLTRPENVIANGLWEVHKDLDPRFFAYHFDKRPLDQMLRDASLSPSYKGEEECNGSKCTKVQLELSKDASASFWIDKEHGYILRRSQVTSRFSENKTVLIQELQIPRLVESNGVWLPAQVTLKTFVPIADATMRPDGTLDTSQLRIKSDRLKVENGTVLLPVSVVQSEVQDFVFGTNCQAAPDTFTLHWPVGTEVTDEITGEVTLVRSVPAHEGPEDTAKPEAK